MWVCAAQSHHQLAFGIDGRSIDSSTLYEHLRIGIECCWIGIVGEFFSAVYHSSRKDIELRQCMAERQVHLSVHIALAAWLGLPEVLLRSPQQIYTLVHVKRLDVAGAIVYVGGIDIVTVGTYRNDAVMVGLAITVAVICPYVEACRWFCHLHVWRIGKEVEVAMFQ